jgi:hypothetical protein
VQLVDQDPDPRHEQDATDGEHPCQYTPSPIHKPMMSHRVGPAMLVRCGTGHLGRESAVASAAGRPPRRRCGPAQSS